MYFIKTRGPNHKWLEPCDWDVRHFTSEARGQALYCRGRSRLPQQPGWIQESRGDQMQHLCLERHCWCLLHLSCRWKRAAFSLSLNCLLNYLAQIPAGWVDWRSAGNDHWLSYSSFCSQMSWFSQFHYSFNGILGVPLQAVIILSVSRPGAHWMSYLLPCQMHHLREEVNPRQCKAVLPSGVTALPWSMSVSEKWPRCRNSVISTVKLLQVVSGMFLV